MLGTYNTLEKLPMVQARALVMGGRHDGITPPAPGAEQIASVLPNSELVIFENSGHYPFIQETKKFFDTLTGWLG